jgi:hypothetical protein
MQSGSFHLYKNYGDLFQPAGENSDEIIFEREYMENAENSKQGSLIGLYFAPIILGGWEGCFSFTRHRGCPILVQMESRLPSLRCMIRRTPLKTVTPRFGLFYPVERGNDCREDL